MNGIDLKFHSCGKINIDDVTRNRDSSGNPFLWCKNVESKGKIYLTKKIATDSPTRGAGFGKARGLPKYLN